MTDVLYLTVERFLRFLPILAVAVIIAKVLEIYISGDRIGMLLKGERRSITGASLLGLGTPGPLALYLPLMKALQTGGLPLSTVAAFITSQTLVGPLRAFLEVDMFGLVFFLYRVAASFIIAVSVGLSFRLLSRHIAPKTPSQKDTHMESDR